MHLYIPLDQVDHLNISHEEVKYSSQKQELSTTAWLLRGFLGSVQFEHLKFEEMLFRKSDDIPEPWRFRNVLSRIKSELKIDLIFMLTSTNATYPKPSQYAIAVFVLSGKHTDRTTLYLDSSGVAPIGHDQNKLSCRVLIGKSIFSHVTLSGDR